MKASLGQTLPPLSGLLNASWPQSTARMETAGREGQLQFHATKVNEKGNACLIKEVHCNPCVPVVSHCTKTPPEASPLLTPPLNNPSNARWTVGGAIFACCSAFFEMAHPVQAHPNQRNCGLLALASDWTTP